MDFIDRVRWFFNKPTRAERDRQKLNLQLDARLFSDMCLTLHKEAPKDSPLLVMDVRILFEEKKPYELECHVKRSTGKNVRFAPSPEAEERLFTALDKLRASMEEQKQPRWKGCKLTVDVPGDKYNVDFRY